MQITFNAQRNRFEAASSYAERLTANPALKSAGFAFDGILKLWHSAGYKDGQNGRPLAPKPMPEQLGIVASLLPYLTPEALADIARIRAEQKISASIEDFASKASLAVVDKAESLAASRATDSNVEVPVPAGLAYLPYQRAGISYAMNRPHVLIGDEMGLGKTIQGIGISNADPNAKRILVICPASLKLNWKREWLKWCVKGLSVGVANTKHFPKTGVVIVNFDIIKKLHTKLIAVAWDMVIIDECHKVKNPKALRTKYILGAKATTKRVTEKIDGREITKMVPVPAIPEIPAGRRVFLTGTPILNRPVELWSLVEKLDPKGLGANFFKFAIRYCNATRKKFGWDFSGNSNLDELQERLRSSFMVRRLKADVLKDLPAKRRQVILVEPDAKGRDLIQKEKVAYENLQMKEGDTIMLAEMSRARKDVAVYKAPFVIEHVQDMLEDDGISKVIVFAHHKEVIDQLMAAFGNAAVKVDGRVNLTEDRQEAIDRFQTDPTCKVFVGSIMAAGVGLTLTASSTVVFAELDWVPANVTQAEDRAHRIGQTAQVLIQHILLDESLDSNMVGKVIEKQAICDAALDTVKAPAAPAEMPPIGEVKKEEPKAVTVHTKKGDEQVSLTPEQIEAVHAAMRFLRGRCDGAHELDDKGFSGTDVRFGWSLAAAPKLSMKQAAYGQKFVKKYQGQLGPELCRAAGVEPKQ